MASWAQWTDALPAADTFFPGHLGGDIGMLAELAFPGSATHTQILEGSAKSGQFMAFEMGHTDQGVGIDDVGGNGDRLKRFFVE